MAAQKDAQGKGRDRTERIGFLLLPEFPVYAFVLATEALRVANQNAGEWLFSSHLITVDGRPVAAGNGMTVVPDLAIDDAPFLPTVIVFACNHPEKHVSRKLRRPANPGHRPCLRFLFALGDVARLQEPFRRESARVPPPVLR